MVVVNLLRALDCRTNRRIEANNEGGCYVILIFLASLAQVDIHTICRQRVLLSSALRFPRTCVLILYKCVEELVFLLLKP